jgi:hypothetical protein
MKIAKDSNFRNMGMETACITLNIVYGSETWNPTKNESKDINKILEH